MNTNAHEDRQKYVEESRSSSITQNFGRRNPVLEAIVGFIAFIVISYGAVVVYETLVTRPNNCEILKQEFNEWSKTNNAINLEGVVIFQGLTSQCGEIEAIEFAKSKKNK